MPARGLTVRVLFLGVLTLIFSGIALFTVIGLLHL